MPRLSFFSFLALISLFACNEPAPRTIDPALENQIAALKQRYAPDRRTDRVEVEWSAGQETDTLSGYTTLPAAYEELQRYTDEAGLVNEIRLLPDSAAEVGTGYGLIRVSVANIRTEPGHSQELTSQALMGTPLALLDRQGGWYLVRTPDRYLAWLESGAIQQVERQALQAWFGDQLRTCVPDQMLAKAAPNGERVVSELVAGNLVQVTGSESGGWAEVKLPDGRTGWVTAKDLAPYRQLASPDSVAVNELLETAYLQAGKPYMWGGTSTKAMDCSGLTKTAYYLNGYVIPRDASQQVHAGTDVPLDAEFSQLQRGDLLFFGNLREDGSERITHVGFYVGDGRFLHAGADNDFITENSLIAEDEDFAEHRLSSLLRARRLEGGADGVVPVDEAFKAIYTKSSSR